MKAQELDRLNSAGNFSDLDFSHGVDYEILNFEDHRVRLVDIFKHFDIVPEFPLHVLRRSIRGIGVLSADDVNAGLFEPMHRKDRQFSDTLVKDVSNNWVLRIDHHGLISMKRPWQS